MTSMEGVFAGGDCGNDKISLAVEAIADAVKSVDIIDAYLSGEKIRYANRLCGGKETISTEKDL